MRKTGLLIPAMLLLAACGAAGEKHYKVPSAAMEPTIKEGTTVTARTVKSGDYNPADGDLVVVRPPAAWGVTGSGDLLIRRVVGVAGETIECCDGTDGQIKRDGKPADEPYLSPQGQTASFPPVKVPAGEIYVMEDRRGSGNDSAQHGTLPVGTVIGVIEH